MDNTQSITAKEKELQCLTELNKVLEKHNCALDVNFIKDSVLGTPILKFMPVVVYKGEK